MSAPRHARPRPPRQRLPAFAVAGAVLVGVALVAAATVHTIAPTSTDPGPSLGASGTSALQPFADSPTGPAPASVSTHPTTASAPTPVTLPVVTGSKRVTARAGTVTVQTTLRVSGTGRVPVRPDRAKRVHGLSALQVERVVGQRMHPFRARVALSKGTVLRLRARYQWHGCPRRAPTAWPDPFALPDHVRLRWHRVDAPLHRRQAVCH